MFYRVAIDNLVFSQLFTVPPDLLDKLHKKFFNMVKDIQGVVQEVMMTISPSGQLRLWVFKRPFRECARSHSRGYHGGIRVHSR
jgi:hypothetical protein